MSDLIEVIQGTEVLALELDDSSHDRPKRQSRDEFLNAALKAAGLSVGHIRHQHSHVASEVYDQVAAALAE